MLLSIRSNLLLVGSIYAVGCGGVITPDGGGGAGGAPQGGNQQGGTAGPGGAAQGGAAEGGAAQGGAVQGGAAQGGAAQGGAAQGGAAPGGAAQGGSTTVADPECKEDTDCFLSSDCCECAGRPNGDSVPPCPILCVVDKCAVLGTVDPPTQAVCRAGRCVTSLNCDDGDVLCDAAPPNCAAGVEPVVVDGCYNGKCQDSAECLAVSNCGVCDDGFACVVSSAFQQTTHCVDDKGCADVDCECLGPSVCISPFSTCNAIDGHIDCSCPNC